MVNLDERALLSFRKILGADFPNGIPGGNPDRNCTNFDEQQQQQQVRSRTGMEA